MSDPIDRQQAIDIVTFECGKWKGLAKEIAKQINALPSALPEPEEFEWCHDCKEYDLAQHCCHRFTKVIRQTVEEIKAEQPERKRGKWVGIGDIPKTCPFCDEDWDKYIIGGGTWYTGETPNFCPNCGADMRGEEG